MSWNVVVICMVVILFSAASREYGTCGGHCYGVYNRFGRFFFGCPHFFLLEIEMLWELSLLSLTFLQVHKAQDIGSKRGKLSVEDFLYLIRKVP